MGLGDNQPMERNPATPNSVILGLEGVLKGIIYSHSFLPSFPLTLTITRSLLSQQFESTVLELKNLRVHMTARMKVQSTTPFSKGAIPVKSIGEHFSPMQGRVSQCPKNVKSPCSPRTLAKPNV